MRRVENKEYDFIGNRALCHSIFYQKILFDKMSKYTLKKKQKTVGNNFCCFVNDVTPKREH
ncbi:hypothetical protein [Senimuribacter intestinalis]|uniref:hypothetical protein n=1 Tax=Senimuribacter intestinalis TaxID=2941507 RepID=UPI00203AAF16|nr:hypothetical protein [Senimuribacter intestinalis]